eukprot:3348398-Amphidinium_carterae.1
MVAQSEVMASDAALVPGHVVEPLLIGKGQSASIGSSHAFNPVPLRTATFAHLPFRLPACLTTMALHDFGLLLPSFFAASSERKQGTSSTLNSGSSLSLALSFVTINIRSLSEAGKIKFLAKRAADIKADVVFVQETRLTSCISGMTVEGYTIVASPASTASGAHGGLAIFVRIDPQLVLASHKAVSHRVLTAQLLIAGKPHRLVCAHGPTAETPLHEHAAFAEHMKVALASPALGESFVVGVDLNARLGGLQDDFACVGALAES